MFSFHKPKIYRSLSGCCICKAKSSSSRFTDSKKYESEFEKCFKIIEKRSGEICNACVLLVKRWKKLPSNTTRNWHHVVDARAGPGTKSIKSKFNNINDNTIKSTTTSLNHSSNHRKPHPNSHRKLLKPKIADDCNDEGKDSVNQLNTVCHQIPSPEVSDSSDSDDDIEEDAEDLEEELEVQKITKRSMDSTSKRMKSCQTSKLVTNTKRSEECDSPTNIAITSFLDMSFWKKEKICCGIIFKGPDNEVLIYPKLLEPCYCRRNKSVVLKSKLSSMVNSGGSDSSSVGSSCLAEDDNNSNASSGNISLT